MSLVDDNSKSGRIEVGCGSGGSPERMGIFDKPTVMPRTQCPRPMAMAKPRPGQTQGEPFMQSLSLTKSECVQMINQHAKSSSYSFLLWTACSLRLLLCRDLLLTPAKPAFLSICMPDTHTHPAFACAKEMSWLPRLQGHRPTVTTVHPIPASLYLRLCGHPSFLPCHPS